jgi:hypothetical protein
LLPAVVLVGESGPLDRDETTGILRPFRDLGDGLAARGIVTIRFDKRCFSQPQLCGRAFTIDDDLVQDAISAVAVVRREPSVDPSRVFIIGHGLGGIAAAPIAHGAGNIAGLVLIAVPARPLLYVSLEEIRGRDPPPPPEVMARAAVQAQGVLDGTAPATAGVLGAPAAFWYDLAKRDPFQDVRQVADDVLGQVVGQDEDEVGPRARPGCVLLAGHGFLVTVGRRRPAGGKGGQDDHHGNQKRRDEPLNHVLLLR